MNRTRFKPAVNGARADFAKGRRFIRRDHAARLGTPVASLLGRDERPVDDDYLTLSDPASNRHASFHVASFHLFIAQCLTRN
jgi:hypothetical protein